MVKLFCSETVATAVVFGKREIVTDGCGIATATKMKMSDEIVGPYINYEIYNMNYSVMGKCYHSSSFVLTLLGPESK